MSAGLAEKPKTHWDKALEKYMIQQNADKAQIRHVLGDIQRWK